MENKESVYACVFPHSPIGKVWHVCQGRIEYLVTIGDDADQKQDILEAIHSQEWIVGLGEGTNEEYAFRMALDAIIEKTGLLYEEVVTIIRMHYREHLRREAFPDEAWEITIRLYDTYEPEEYKKDAYKKQ